ncbi:MAG: pyrroline-5-carboxylate reductase [Deltaproteobacteria bacterium]|nr:pyrroline-5-carboxylate reductase [Deltaproteobacteria bacterium]
MVRTGSSKKTGGEERTPATTVRVGFIGGGNMAEALLRGLLAAGYSAEELLVSEPLAERRRLLARRYRVGVTGDNQAVMRSAQTIILAVKPQVLGDLLGSLGASATSKQLFVSIAAGVPLARLEEGLGAGARVVRVMPNTPSLVGKGAAVLCGGSAARAADLRTVRKIFAAVGDAHVIADEKLMHAVTALSGSGPAYVYRFAEVLLEAGVKAGLDRDLAAALTFQTLAGAAQMMLATGQSPQELRRAVSSPGGTTLAGLARLDEGGLEGVVAAAVRAAAARSVELGKM